MSAVTEAEIETNIQNTTEIVQGMLGTQEKLSVTMDTLSHFSHIQVSFTNNGS